MLKQNIFMILFILIFTNVSGQKNNGNLVYNEFIFSDSSKITGTIIFENNNVIQIKKKTGDEIRVNKRFIISRKIITPDKVRTDTLMHKPEVSQDPSVCKLFLTPTARNLKAGKGYVALNELIMPNAAIGLTDWLSVSGYVFLLPINQAYFFFSVQGKIYENNFSSVALGGVMRMDLINFQNNYELYGIYTLYNSKLMLNIGGGIDFVTKNILFTFGGEVDINGKNKLITDNWFMGNGEFILFFGGKSYGKNFSASLGIMSLYMLTKESLETSEKVECEGIGPWISFTFYF